jgi:hypothetical protein
VPEGGPAAATQEARVQPERRQLPVRRPPSRWSHGRKPRCMKYYVPKECRNQTNYEMVRIVNRGGEGVRRTAENALNWAYPKCNWHVIDGCGLQIGEFIATQLSGDLCVPKDSDLFVISMQTASKGVGRIVTATPGTWPFGQASRCFAAGSLIYHPLQHPWRASACRAILIDRASARRVQTWHDLKATDWNSVLGLPNFDVGVRAVTHRPRPRPRPSDALALGRRGRVGYCVCTHSRCSS